MKNKVKEEINQSFIASKNHEFKIEEWKNEEWEEIKDLTKKGRALKDTGIKVSLLKELGEKITTLPDDWAFHPIVKKIYEARRNSIKDGKGIDWGTAEALAFASLIQEGYHVRVSGQDVERGTFSHRHAVVFDQNKDNRYTPINTIIPNADI